MMRNPLPVFAVSAALFIVGIGFVLVGARSARSSPATTATPAPAVAPVATTAQIMSGIVSPTSTAIFQSVQTNVTEQGTEEIAPHTDEEWPRVGARAASLADAGNLLMPGGRAVDRGDWIKMSRAMVD